MNLHEARAAGQWHPGARLPNGIRIASNQIPIRWELRLGNSLKRDWAGILDFEPDTLYRLMGLDPFRFYFELPSSCRGVGSLSSGNRGNLRITGFAFMRGVARPVGKITEIKLGDKIFDDDPEDLNEWEKFK